MSWRGEFGRKFFPPPNLQNDSTKDRGKTKKKMSKTRHFQKI